MSNHTINGNVSYEACLVRAVEILEGLTPEDVARDCEASNGDMAVATDARNEQLASFRKSLARIADDTERPDYDYIVPGVATLPGGDGTIYLWGLAMSKTVIKPGTYKKVNSKSKTLVKRYLQRLTPVSKFRRFKLTPGTFRHVSVAGEQVA